MYQVLRDPFTEARLSGLAAHLPPKGEKTGDRLLDVASGAWDPGSCPWFLHLDKQLNASSPCTSAPCLRVPSVLGGPRDLSHTLRVPMGSLSLRAAHHAIFAE